MHRVFQPNYHNVNCNLNCRHLFLEFTKCYNYYSIQIVGRYLREIIFFNLSSYSERRTPPLTYKNNQNCI